ncbi:hypothetical protein F941_02058 [Acinetobacter bouvetii DSM 14964 = CIP 107468]|uniref:Uncharacterized protein n=2 Tax=Moraxellaceae TaxID=468 RepID=N9DP64_9GAMM|nr:hypothetical protein F941_02058 [Acinetobacter bouvetii DSM 14964 = CIP 107468]BCU64341.1 hypothetical protein ACBO_11320 [Acinetobacter bouvetii]
MSCISKFKEDEWVINMKKALVMLVLFAVMTAAANVQANTKGQADSSSQEVAACTNGFDSVNVCELLS